MRKGFIRFGIALSGSVFAIAVAFLLLDIAPQLVLLPFLVAAIVCARIAGFVPSIIIVIVGAGFAWSEQAFPGLLSSGPIGGAVTGAALLLVAFVSSRRSSARSKPATAGDAIAPVVASKPKVSPDRTDEARAVKAKSEELERLQQKRPTKVVDEPFFTLPPPILPTDSRTSPSLQSPLESPAPIDPDAGRSLAELFGRMEAEGKPPVIASKFESDPPPAADDFSPSKIDSVQNFSRAIPMPPPPEPIPPREVAASVELTPEVTSPQIETPTDPFILGNPDTEFFPTVASDASLQPIPSIQQEESEPFFFAPAPSEPDAAASINESSTTSSMTASTAIPMFGESAAADSLAEPIVPSNYYELTCFVCQKSFNAYEAEWCECLVRERSLLCPNCGRCSCKAPATYRHKLWINAPADLMSARRREATPGDEAVPEHTRPLILVVEDESDMLAIVSLLIRSLGYGLLVARDGEEGLRIAKLHRPDLVVSDALLPKMDGREMCRLLKEDRALEGVRTVVMTGVYTYNKYKSEALSAFRVDAYIFKPINMDELKATIGRLLAVPQDATRTQE